MDSRTTRESFIYRSLQASSEWARFADPKLLGVLVLLGLGLTSLLSHAGELADAHHKGSLWGWVSTVGFWGAISLAAVTVLLVSLGLFPRLKPGSNRGRSLFYFGGISRYSSAAEYESAVRQLDDVGLESELARQAWEVAVIASAKHRWAKRAYWTVLAFLVAWSASLIGLRFS